MTLKTTPFCPGLILMLHSTIGLIAGSAECSPLHQLKGSHGGFFHFKEKTFFNSVKISSEKQPLADSIIAELIWKSCASKKWNDALCELAATLMSSPDPVAVMYAQWAIEIRIGYQNSQNVAVWTEDMENKPNWFTAWLQFPVERYPEMDYWRVCCMHSVHRSLTGGGMKIPNVAGQLSLSTTTKESMRHDERSA